MRSIAFVIVVCGLAYGQKPVPEPPASSLTPAAHVAMSMAKEWQEGDPLPTPGENGTVVYQWGAAMPPIVCSPDHLTSVLLEVGEIIQGEPLLADRPRWWFEISTAGEGPTRQASVVLKPRRPGISTDMMLATNRRRYQLRLVSTSNGAYLSQVEFSYPVSATWLAYRDQEITRAEEKRKNTVSELQGPVNFAYTVKPRGKEHPPFTPRTVYDDGHQTSFKMPPEAKDWDTAVLQTGGPNGCEIVNYRVAGDTWIVDRLFQRAQLISGTGPQAKVVDIFRDGVGSVNCQKKGKIEQAKK